MRKVLILDLSLFIGLNVYDDVAFSLLLEIILPHFFSSDILFCLLLMK